MGETNNQSNIIANFFLDGAKIIFGSLVIGIFVPNAAAPAAPWSIFVVGIILTVTFLLIAKIASKKNF